MYCCTAVASNGTAEHHNPHLLLRAVRVIMTMIALLAAARATPRHLCVSDERAVSCFGGPHSLGPDDPQAPHPRLQHRVSELEEELAKFKPRVAMAR